MRFIPLSATLVLAFTAGCVWPTGDDIEDSIEQELSSVTGAWHGETTGANRIVLDLNLSQSGTQVQGTGTMREQAASAAVAVTATGTFQRPALALTISGMVYEGRAVTGTIQTNYTNLAIADSLRLTATGYSRSLAIILSED